ncbi:MAG: YfcE family phosphodiesterase [Desulfobulbus sp.]|nr:MAG: YfcE family phosphodiesterase [Desulfobulbus sp.]RUM41776.1 MAG: YfcE family phosphodiesterase [Desulfobulbus sp.]
MLIAILSDSHDHIPNLQRAVLAANREGAEMLIHCGDLISPFMLPQLHAFNGPVHLIYGNNAGDQHLISSRCETMFANISHHGLQGEVEIAELRICFIHYPDTARALALTGDYDVVCCGHNHVAAVERFGRCLLINPGDLLGKDEKPGFMLLNTADKSVKRIIVGELLEF